MKAHEAEKTAEKSKRRSLKSKDPVHIAKAKEDEVHAKAKVEEAHHAEVKAKVSAHAAKKADTDVHKAKAKAVIVTAAVHKAHSDDVKSAKKVEKAAKKAAVKKVTHE